MRLNLLEMVQHILGSMQSDEVSNYDDTVESYQVAQIIRQAFYDCAAELGLPEHESMFELNASGDNAKPTLMTIPSNVTRLDTIRYDNKLVADTHSDMREVKYMNFEDFFRMQQALREDTSNVGTMVVTNNGESFNFIYRSNGHPRFYTTMDDNTLIFDSYDSSIDTTLQKSKSMCNGAVYPSFTMSNAAYPDIDATQFPYLLAKAKTRAFNEIKQTINQESASEARRQKIIVQKRQRTVTQEPEIYRVARYGRR